VVSTILEAVSLASPVCDGVTWGRGAAERKQQLSRVLYRSSRSHEVAWGACLDRRGFGDALRLVFVAHDSRIGLQRADKKII
jgi:hypothetical protein